MSSVSSSSSSSLPRSDSGAWHQSANQPVPHQFIQTPPHWAYWFDEDPETKEPTIGHEATVTALFIPRAAFALNATTFGQFIPDNLASSHYRTVLSVLMYCAGQLPSGRYKKRPELVVAVESMLTEQGTVAGYLFTFACQPAPAPARKHRRTRLAGFRLRRNTSDNDEDDEPVVEDEADDDDDDDDDKTKKKRLRPRSMFEALSNLLDAIDKEVRGRADNPLKRVRLSHDGLHVYQRVSKASWIQALGAVTSEPVDPDDFKFFSARAKDFSPANPCDPANFLDMKTAMINAKIANVQPIQCELANYVTLTESHTYKYTRPIHHLVRRLYVDTLMEDRILSTFFPEIPVPAPPINNHWHRRMVIEFIRQKHPALTDEQIQEQVSRFDEYHFQDLQTAAPNLVGYVCVCVWAKKRETNSYVCVCVFLFV
jgi:hypothetical protein